MAVEFGEDQMYASRAASTQPRGITGLVIRVGLATTARAANVLLLSITVACVLTAVALWYFSSSPQSTFTSEEYLQYTVPINNNSL